MMTALKSTLLAAAAAVALVAPALANDKEVVNPTCRLEPEANCNWGELRKVKAKGKDLHDASFLSARLDEADLEGANLSSAMLQVTNLYKANLKKANLAFSHMHAVNLVGANLEGANLDGVSLLDANLEGANLKGASIHRVTWTAANLSGATWVDGRVCKPGSIGECK